MARSHLYTPVTGNTLASSEKKDKRIANRRERRRVRQIVNACSLSEFDSLVLPLKRELSNVWDFDKDGKHRFAGLLRRDPAYYAKLMRK